jgi:hypothetical protein
MEQDLILATLKEIRDDQKKLLAEVAEIKKDMDSSFNGYEPHEIAELLHHVNDNKIAKEKFNDTVRKAVITWAVPILLTATLVGLFGMGLWSK